MDTRREWHFQPADLLPQERHDEPAGNRLRYAFLRAHCGGVVLEQSELLEKPGRVAVVFDCIAKRSGINSKAQKPV